MKTAFYSSPKSNYISKISYLQIAKHTFTPKCPIKVYEMLEPEYFFIKHRRNICNKNAIRSRKGPRRLLDNGISWKPKPIPGKIELQCAIVVK